MISSKCLSGKAGNRQSSRFTPPSWCWPVESLYRKLDYPPSWMGISMRTLHVSLFRTCVASQRNPGSSWRFVCVGTVLSSSNGAVAAKSKDLTDQIARFRYKIALNGQDSCRLPSGKHRLCLARSLRLRWPYAVRCTVRWYRSRLVMGEVGKNWYAGTLDDLGFCWQYERCSLFWVRCWPRSRVSSVNLC